MKKFISFIIVIIILSSCFVTNVFAKDITVTFSDDFQEVYLNGETYTPMDLSDLSTQSMDVFINVSLTTVQEPLIKDLIVYSNASLSVMSAEIYYSNGIHQTVTYLRNDCKDDVEKLINGDVTEYVINFDHEEVTSIKTNTEAMLSKRSVIYKNEYENADFYKVLGKRSSEGFSILAGSMLSFSGEYYYVDFEENDVGDYQKKIFYPTKFEHLIVHKITDRNLIQDLKNSENELYNTDFGFLYDDEFTESASKVSLLIGFIILPAILLVVFLIRTIRNKGVYKKLFGAVTILSAAELVTATIIYIIAL